MEGEDARYVPFPCRAFHQCDDLLGLRRIQPRRRFVGEEYKGGSDDLQREGQTPPLSSAESSPSSSSSSSAAAAVLSHAYAYASASSNAAVSPSTSPSEGTIADAPIDGPPVQSERIEGAIDQRQSGLSIGNVPYLKVSGQLQSLAGGEHREEIVVLMEHGYLTVGRGEVGFLDDGRCCVVGAFPTVTLGLLRTSRLALDPDGSAHFDPSPLRGGTAECGEEGALAAAARTDDPAHLPVGDVERRFLQ
mmetsp:Transcript_60509/g.179335  ORF Transcript_60509/g.179335 Transcript_60509/m.179335 type:complete len:248 (-) Transcript_60509:202-945(-)